MSVQDVAIGALCAWRENRGGQPQPDAMQSVLNVLVNRAKQRGTDIYTEATRKLQFSSLTAPGDPQLDLWPNEADPHWQQALLLAQDAETGNLEDITNGSTIYYAPAAMAANAVVPYTLPNGTQTVFPKDWNQSAVSYQCEIANQLFFREA
jgi:hypothetical protein